MTQISFTAEFELGEMLYIKSDNNQGKWQLVAYAYHIDGGISYDVCQVGHHAMCMAAELSRNKDYSFTNS